MKKQSLLALSMLFAIFLVLQSCSKENDLSKDGDNENNGETKISSYSSSESHNMGENCMNCHISGGEGEGYFTAAGTVYDNNQNSTYPNATVKLYSEPNGGGSLIATLQVDKKGNFYTTQSINFGNGLYVSVEGNNSTKTMGSSITMGKCNSCHGVTTEKVWTN